MPICHIVAAAENNVIGTQNTLPWDIPEDMAFFKEKTKGHAVIMGRKTYDSMGKPLPNRLNVIVTRQKDFKVPGAVVLPTLNEAISYCRKQTDKYGEEIFIIGGGEIYKQSMDLVDIIYLTRIHRPFKGDVTYPEVDPKIFEEIERRERSEPIPFTFLTYCRRHD